MDPDLTRDPIVAARPQLDAYVRAVMRARTRAELFGTVEPVCVGRYELRRHLGTGGGGTVFVAWDGELAREVALKLIVAPEPQRALAEGQALAQLSHPNIVPVFDVGTVDDRVYLVMELVRGVSLREYARDARPHEILRAYRQSALGLAAAHAARLVHRDFKPDNAVIDSDGRVRVIDFGLAHTEGAEAERSGTPAYMAPEQLRGGTLTAAVDQYALAVSIREALGEPTGKLGRVLARATADDPAQRFPSVNALERALAFFDPRARRRRRALIAAPLAIAGIVYGIGQMRTEVTPCSRDDAALAGVWSPVRRVELTTHLASLGTAYNALDRLDVLDHYATTWLASHHAGCVAHRDGELSAERYDRQQACLASARTQLATLAELGMTSHAGALTPFVRAIPELPDLASCADPTLTVPPTLAQEPRARALRERLDRERVHVQAGVADVPALDAIVADARALDYRPLVADALLLVGTAHLLAWRFEAADPLLHEAYLEQLHLANHGPAVEAFARYAWVHARIATAPASETVNALADGLPRSARFAQALLHNNLGSIALMANDAPHARDEFARAIKLAHDVTGPGAVELTAALSNLALVTDDPVRQQALYAQRIAILTRALGPDHELVLATQKTAALVLADPETAAGALAAPCDRLVALHPDSRVPIAECGLHRGWLAFVAGDVATARQQLELAGPGLGAAYLALVSGDRSSAAQFRTLLAGASTESWSQLFDAGQAELGLGMAGDVTAFARAKDLLSRARALHPRWSPIAWRLAWLARV